MGIENSVEFYFCSQQQQSIFDKFRNS